MGGTDGLRDKVGVTMSWTIRYDSEEMASDPHMRGYTLHGLGGWILRPHEWPGVPYATQKISAAVWVDTFGYGVRLV